LDQAIPSFRWDWQKFQAIRFLDHHTVSCELRRRIRNPAIRDAEMANLFHQDLRIFSDDRF